MSTTQRHVITRRSRGLNWGANRNPKSESLEFCEVPKNGGPKETTGVGAGGKEVRLCEVARRVHWTARNLSGNFVGKFALGIGPGVTRDALHWRMFGTGVDGSAAVVRCRREGCRVGPPAAQ